MLDAAVQCFWAEAMRRRRFGISWTKTGITAASLYNAFGDKRRSIPTALDQYIEGSVGERAPPASKALPPREAIGAFFEEIMLLLERRTAKGLHAGQFGAGAGAARSEFQKIIAGVLVEAEKFFRRLVEAGQKDGTISTSQPADDLARLLLGVFLGIRVLARVRPERELLEGWRGPSLPCSIATWWRR